MFNKELETIRSGVWKLWRHLKNIQRMRTKPHPIEVVIVATSKCNLKCSFCYVGNRDRTNELDIDKLKHFIDVIKPLSVEITGGEPCLYSKINELIEFLYKKKIKIGMTSNGTCYDLLGDNIKKLAWLRISINHFIDNNIPFKDPKFPRKYGYIYIKTKTGGPVNLLRELREFMKTHRGKYLKVAVDVTDESVVPFKSISEYNIIGQDRRKVKFYKGFCYMRYLKPIIEPDGLVYSCVSNVDPKLRVKNVKHAITTIDEPEKLLEYNDIFMYCPRCEFWDRNELIDYIFKDYVEDEEFL